MKGPRKRSGRPTVTAAPGQKATLGIRASPDLKTHLLEAARQAARSLSAEAELRLEYSFRADTTLFSVFDLAYGGPNTGILLLLGMIMREAAARGVEWLDNPDEFAAVSRALTQVLSVFRPDGSIVSEAGATELAEYYIRKLQQSLNIDEPLAPASYLEVQVRNRLGSRTTRLAKLTAAAGREASPRRANRPTEAK
jgi:hypothetical protein